MKRCLQIGLSLLLTLIMASACHDKSEDVVELSMLELVKSGKKKPKMVYSTSEKGGRLGGGDEDEQVKFERLEVTMDVEGADLHFHVEGFLKTGYLYIQDNSRKVIFTQIIEAIDEQHSLDIFLPNADNYPYYLCIESEKYIAHINVWLE